MIARTLSTGMAKPRPWAPARMAVLMPMSSPRIFRSGPPELPGLMGASVWMRPSYFCVGEASIVRSRAETTPVVTVCW